MSSLSKVEPINQLPLSIKAISEKDMKELLDFTKELAKAPFYQKMGSGGVLAIWLTAKEMGLPPMMCLNGGMYTFSGQVTLSSKVLNMLLIRAGHRAEILKLDENSCKIRFVRGDRQKDQNRDFEYEYTIEDARKAGLLKKNNWITNTKDMLYNRCLSGGSIKHMPDATNGAYVIGEMPGDGEILDCIPEDVVLPKNENKDVKLTYTAKASIKMDDFKENESNVKPLYIEKLSMEEVIELQTILNDCDDKYKKKVNEFLPKKYEVDLLDDVPKTEYEILKSAFIKKRDENQKKLAEAEMEMKTDVNNEVL
jgi:hypothetical protein